jgi:creatinine amidohydrolase
MKRTDSNLLAEINPNLLSDIKNTSGIAYLPLGTLEWHQHHLPFGVDSYIAYELCKRTVQQTGGCVMPPIYFGTDREHQVDGKQLHGMDAKAGRILPGNFYFLKEDFFSKLLEQIIDNIAEQGLKKLVIVSAHSGTAQQRVIEKLKKDNRRNLEIVIFPGRLFAGGIDHAGAIETSYMLAIRPDLVDVSKLGEPPYEALIGDDPRQASAEDGEKRLQETVEQIVGGVSK